MKQQQRGMSSGMPESYGKRMWHLWGPFLIKIGISYIVSSAFMAIFMALYLVMKNGYDTQAMMEIYQNQEAMQEMYDIVMKQAQDYTVVIEGLAALVTIPVMMFLFHRDRVKEKIAGVIPNNKASLWKYIGVVVMAAAMCIGLNNLILLSGLSAGDEAYEEMLTAMYNPPVAVQLVCLGILTPVCEEFVFRGLMFKRIRERSSFVHAALYTAFVFGFIHMYLVQMIYAFVMGLMFAYVYEKYGSVKAPVIAHVTANILSVLGTEGHWFDWMMADPMRMGIITVACAAVASTAFVLIQRIEEKPDIPGKSGESENLAAV